MTDEPYLGGSKLTPEQIKNVEDFVIGGPEYMDGQQVIIPAETIDRWTGIPLDAKVAIHVTRGDLDRLYFCFTQMAASSTMIQETARLLNFGDTDGANITHRKAAVLTAAADANFRKFFTAVMQGAATYE
ncbi:MAG: hypothetical protein JWR80_4824 [Bradyrhizobium sp.]|nr:hypothetical protein [Bradyrhizobium sp.]